MRRLISGLAALPFLAGVAPAAQPVPLNDPQMDVVTAGAAETSGGLTFLPATPTLQPSYGLLLFFFNETDRTNTGTVIVNESPVPCTACYLNNTGTENLVVQAAFGPTAPK
jgi:hypothetical protein